MTKYLFVGLGNIGTEYAHTRHNIGFDALTHLIQNKELTFEAGKYAYYSSFRLKGRKVICIKPTTYMNLSGKAVAYWMQKEKISIQNTLIITDDLHLPFGTLRLKPKGSAGGHNGLEDIQLKLGTSQYYRLRFGIGDNYSNGRQAEYVLSPWSSEEKEALIERLQRVSLLLESFVLQGADKTMNAYNGS